MEPTVVRAINGGTQKIYKFPNGYGASVVQHNYSYGGSDGMWELAVVVMDGESDLSFDLCYDTPITDDVIGHLTESNVAELLERISKLEQRDTL